MLTIKKKVIFLSYLGIIPFYCDILISYLNNSYNFKLFQNINLVSFVLWWALFLVFYVVCSGLNLLS